uniref:E3 ubiquitin-protein ligase HACE1 n=1 Tax=Ciona savignyi TaxID=51511 RepID=H2ZBM3_CIOSA
MWSPKHQLMRLSRSLRIGRSVELPRDPASAIHILLPMVFGNQHKSLSELLENSPFDVNHPIGRSNRTLLHIAANCGQLECVACLLKHGADPNAIDIAGCCAIHLASKNGKKRCMEKLLEFGADPDVADIDGVTSLHWIAVSGRLELLSVILHHTSHIQVEDKQGHTPLHAAARNGHDNVIESLIKSGADPNYRNSNGLTPLHSACINGQRQAVAALLSHNAVMTSDNEGQTPLDLCIEGGYGVAIELLVKKYPKMLTTFVNNAVNKHNWKIEKVQSTVEHFSTKPLGHEVSTKLAEISVDLGFQLLSLSSTCKENGASLLRSITLLLSSLSTNSDREFFFNLFEPLWKALEEWILLLGNEQSPKKQLPTENLVDSPSTQNKSSNNLILEEENQSKLELAETVSQKNQSLTKSSQVDVPEPPRNPNMISDMSGRISVLIEVFWRCVSAQDGTVGTPHRFYDFIVRHVDVINRIINYNPKVIFKNFSFLLHDPKLMAYFFATVTSQPFADRYEWFYSCLYENRPHGGQSHLFQVRREKVFEDSCQEFGKISAENLKGNFMVQFTNEEGMGNGVLREWFSVLSNEILNPEYGLFVPSFDGCSFQPNSRSSINPDHLSYFEFAGKILSVALYHKHLINASLTSSFYKHLLGRKISYEDVESIDPEYATNLQWILDNDISDIGLNLNFTVETDVFGRMEEIELTPGGSRLSVTEENKQEYVQLVTELKMTSAIQRQLDSFIRGFNSIIPSYLIRIFTPEEMDLMLTGCREIDVEIWKSITEYSGCYNPTHQVIQWFWECVERMQNDDRSLLLHFSTGRSRLPAPNVIFSNKFMITSIPPSDLLPSASTCMSLLKLPEYDSYETLETKLLTAIRCGSLGYTQT